MGRIIFDGEASAMQPGSEGVESWPFGDQAGAEPPTEALGALPIQSVPGRADRYTARRLGKHIAITAVGKLPRTGITVDLKVSPILIYPPQFELRFLIPAEPGNAVILPFVHSEVFPFPADRDVVIVRDAEGPHPVPITDVADLAASFYETGKGQYLGLSKRSIEAALEQAIGLAEADVLTAPDQEIKFKIIESGKLKGGIAGRNLYFATVECDVMAAANKAFKAFMSAASVKALDLAEDLDTEFFAYIPSEALEEGDDDLVLVAKADSQDALRKIKNFNPAGGFSRILRSDYKIDRLWKTSIKSDAGGYVEVSGCRLESVL